MTAVELLFKQLFGEDFRMTVSDYQLDLFQQAKAMEKEQIIAAFDIACEDDDRIGREYYNETFTSIPQDETPFAIETEQS